jgi:hypothetical protein
MWPAYPTWREMFWMLWKSLKEPAPKPVKTCPICDAPNPTVRHKKLLICRGCHQKLHG